MKMYWWTWLLVGAAIWLGVIILILLVWAKNGGTDG